MSVQRRPLRRARRAALRRVPLAAFERLLRPDLVGLAYHTIEPRVPPHLRGVSDCKTPADFAADLDYLLAEHAPVSYADVRAARLGAGPPLPRRAVLVTFDDGYRGCLEHAAPLLLERGVPAVFFVATGLLDNRALLFRSKAVLCERTLRSLPPDARKAALDRLGDVARRSLPALPHALRWLHAFRADDPALDAACDAAGVDVQAYLARERPYMTREEVRRLADVGFEVGAHSITHPRLDGLAEPALRAEVLGSCAEVRALVGADEVPFALPFSGRGLEPGVLARLRADDPGLGLVFDSRRFRRTEPFVVNRLMVDRRPPPGGPASTLPDDLRSAYVNELGRRARGVLGGG